MKYDAPHGAVGGGETQNAPHQSQMHQPNVTHILGDVIASQNNIDVDMVERNVSSLAEAATRPP